MSEHHSSRFSKKGFRFRLPWRLTALISAGQHHGGTTKKVTAVTFFPCPNVNMAFVCNVPVQCGFWSDHKQTPYLLYNGWYPGLLVTKRQNVLPSNLTKSRSREIGCCNGRNAPNFHRHFGNAAVGVPVKFQSDWKSLNPNLAASRLHEILR